jgi:hypothetical protein
VVIQFSLVLIIGCLILPGTASAGMYKWYDDEGNVHYTQLPPPPGARQAPISSHINTAKSKDKTPGQHATPPVPNNFNRHLNQSRPYRSSKKRGSTASSADTDKRVREWRRQRYQEKINKIRNGENTHSGAATGR